MRARLPAIILSNLESILDLIENGVNGILIKADNHVDWRKDFASFGRRSSQEKLASNAMPIRGSRYYRSRITVK